MSGLKQYINKFRNKHRFFVYNIRWQLGTPIYTVVLAVFLPKFGLLWSTIIANFVGACFFFLPDTLIFNKTNVKKTRQTDLKEFVVSKKK